MVLRKNAVFFFASVWDCVMILWVLDSIFDIYQESLQNITTCEKVSCLSWTLKKEDIFRKIRDVDNYILIYIHWLIHIVQYCKSVAFTSKVLFSKTKAKETNKQIYICIQPECFNYASWYRLFQYSPNSST